MPIVQITVVAGRDAACLKHSVKAVARSVHETLGAPLGTIRVIVHEVPASYFCAGDETRDEIDARQAADSSGVS